MSLLLLLNRRLRSGNTPPAYGSVAVGKHGKSDYSDTQYFGLSPEQIHQQNRTIIQLMLGLAATGALQ